jgi:hypothetical protein
MQIPRNCLVLVYGVTQILDPFSVACGTQIGRTNRKRIVHADNARPQPAKITLDFMERSALKSALYPPYSQDLAPSDFDLSGYVKQLLRGYEFTDRTTFLHAIEYILGHCKSEIGRRLSQLDGETPPMW